MCEEQANGNCFTILDTASRKWQLKLKEGLYIGWDNPNLNKQVKYVNKTLTI